MRNKGFTLIELMIVIAIIAIIAAIAIPSLLRSRMATNQTAAAAACKALAEAEEIFRRSDYDTDGVLEYATTMSGDFSLLERTAGLGDIGLIDRTFGQAEGAPGTVAPKAGYVFNLQTEQGIDATGGARLYHTTHPVPAASTGPGSPSMTLGYGCAAVPASYDGTGRDTFVINNNGVIFQSDTAGTYPEPIFNPTPGIWVPSE